MGKWLSNLSINRPVTICMGVLAILLLGVLSYIRLPLQLFPNGYTPPFAFVRIQYPNSTPKEVEDEVTKPAEAMLATILGIEKMRSWSGGGSVGIFIRFRGDMNSNEIYNQVRDRMERLMPTLPEDADRYFIWRWDPNSSPIYSFGISYEKENPHLYSFFEEKLFKKLEAMPGVSKVDIHGLQKASVRIEVDRNLAKSHRISIYQLMRQLRSDNFSLPSGQIPNGQKVFFLKSQSRLNSIQDLENYPLTSSVKLKDIAKIHYGVDQEPFIFRVNGRFAFSVNVFKASNVNTVDLCKKIQSRLDELFQKDRTFKKYRLHLYSNQGKIIADSLYQLQESALWGGFFALLVLFVFLRHYRITLLVTLCIPLCILATIGYMYFANETLNLISLLGLMLSVGMVVDNAIVVVENIARFRQEGKSNREACLEGASEVGLAILLATLTTIIVFLPLAIMDKGGMIQFYLSKVAMPVVVSLVVSLFVALLVIPVGAYYFMGDQKPKEWKLFDRMILQYKKVLRFMLRHRLLFAFLTIVAVFSMRIPMKKVKQEMMGGDDGSSLSLRFTFGKNQTHAQKDGYLQSVEQILKGLKKSWGIEHVQTQLNRYDDTARIEVYLDKVKAQENGLSLDKYKMREDMSKLLPKMPGVVRRVGWRPVGGDSQNSITMRLYGSDSKTLEDLAKQVEAHLHLFPEFASVEADVDQDALPEIQFLIQKELANRFQLSSTMIGGNISYALGGRKLRDMRINGKLIDVQIQMDPKSHRSLQQLKELPINSQTTIEPVPLKNLVRNVFTKGPRNITHTNRKTFRAITIQSAGGDIQKLYGRMSQVMKTFPLPQGYSWDQGMEFTDWQKSDRERIFAMLLSIVFVFMIIGILFESYLLPFSVILAIPLSLVGVYWTLYLTDTVQNIMANIGLILLVGIVVNHAIVLVDRINQLKMEGISREEAIVEGGSQRIRPILMTALTTVFGLIPMLMGNANLGGVAYKPLGVTVIGGLLTSLFLSLLVVPLFYTLLDDLRNHFYQIFAWLRSRKTG